MADASFKYSKRRRRSLARRRKQWESDAYNPLTPFPNSEACQLSWSARWFSRFEARVRGSNPSRASFHSFFLNLHIFQYFFYFSILFNILHVILISFHIFISALKNYQKYF